MDSHTTPTVDVSAFRKGGPSVPVRITDDMTTLEVDNRVVATTRFSEHAAGLGASLVKLRSFLMKTNYRVDAEAIRDRGSRP
jgi:hypothetical protein